MYSCLSFILKKIKVAMVRNRLGWAIGPSLDRISMCSVICLILAIKISRSQTKSLHILHSSYII